ncbi:MAG: glycosyltransferase family 87 protein [Acidocella sp.]|nr:glycosyltransferase family 87 protein [Acidocella sp.]
MVASTQHGQATLPSRWMAYVVLALLLPLSLLQLRITGHWITDVIVRPAGLSRLQLRNEASPDFQMFATAGGLALRGEPGRDYSKNPARAINSRFGRAPSTWLYPPPAFLIAPLATIGGLRLGFVIWTLCLLAVAMLVLRWAGVAWVPIALGLASPASIWSINLGQFAFCTGALFFASLLMLDRAPLRAGALIGVLIIKPQTALISPFLLLTRERYRAFAAASAVVISLVGFTTLLFGWPLWREFLAAGTATQRAILVAPFPHYGEIWGVSIFWMLRSFSLPVPISLAGQAMGAMAAIFWGVKLWRDQNVDPLNRAAITICLTLLITPYAYTDDMSGYSLALCALIWRARRLTVADVALIMWPALCPVVSILFHAELTPIFIVWAAIRAGRGATRQLKYSLPPN